MEAVAPLLERARVMAAAYSQKKPRAGTGLQLGESQRRTWDDGGGGSKNFRPSVIFLHEPKEASAAGEGIRPCSSQP